MILQPHLPQGLQNSIANSNTIEASFERTKKRRKTLLRITYVRVKVFIWNLSPLHWYDGMKDIKIHLDQFETKTIKK